MPIGFHTKNRCCGVTSAEIIDTKVKQACATGQAPAASAVHGILGGRRGYGHVCSAGEPPNRRVRRKEGHRDPRRIVCFFIKVGSLEDLMICRLCIGNSTSLEPHPQEFLARKRPKKSRCPCGHRLDDCLAWRMQSAATLHERRGDFLDRAVGLRLAGFLFTEPGAA